MRTALPHPRPRLTPVPRPSFCSQRRLDGRPRFRHSTIRPPRPGPPPLPPFQRPHPAPALPFSSKASFRRTRRRSCARRASNPTRRSACSPQTPRTRSGSASPRTDRGTRGSTLSSRTPTDLPLPGTALPPLRVVDAPALSSCRGRRRSPARRRRCTFAPRTPRARERPPAR